MAARQVGEQIHRGGLRLSRFDCQDRADWLTPKRLGAWLASAGYKGCTDPAVLHSRLNARPRGFTGPEGAAYVKITTALVATLTSLVAQIAELSAQIRRTARRSR